MRSTLLNYLTSGLVALYAASLFAADSEPHMKIKICNPAESMCADVIGTNKLKVIDEDIVLAITTPGVNALTANILRTAELAITSRNEVDFGSTYTVPAGKKFIVTSFSGSYDSQAALYIRFKKQTNGTGSFATIFRINMMSGGQGNSTITYALGNGVIVSTNPTDVFKITVEASISKGTVSAHFAGVEY